jgi:transposase
MRKSFDALSGLVQSQMHRNVMSGDVYIFINRPCNRMKLLRWEPGGFILYYKRLESGTFERPQTDNCDDTLSLSWHDLVMIVQGVQLHSVKLRKRYKNQASC